MLVEAYCYEDDVIENARYAWGRAQMPGPADHWFCPVCEVPVFPRISTLQNFYYSVFQHSTHGPLCPHITVQTHSGSGTPSYTPTPPPPPVFPDILGVAPPRNRRVFNPAAPINLTQLIANAPRARVYGTLEQIVDGWQQMSQVERAARPLEVGGFQATYDLVFLNLDAQPALPAAHYWPIRIYLTEVKIRAGAVLYFVASNRTFTNAAGNPPSLALTVRIKPDNALQTAKPGIAQRLSGMNGGVLFWNGPPPVVVAGTKVSTHALAGGGSALADNFALR
jgi:hypothetical protein